MDPMCSWCYGFQPELDEFLHHYPNAQITWVMGGLAPDNDEPMDNELKQTIVSYWHQIESKTQVTFNHDFWQLNTPYRSTFMACRAVIAAETLRENSASEMAKAIQAAYYQQAKNPSLVAILVDCAINIGLNKDAFSKTLASDETQTRLEQDFALSHQLGVSGFPSLFYIAPNNHAYPLALGYCKTAQLIQQQQKYQAAKTR